VVEVRRLSQLLVLAEELNFHRAAERLHMSQPALSRSIRNLEIEIGAVVVERTTRSVALTDAGSELVDRSRPLLDNLESVIGAVGFKAGAAGRLLTPVVRAFEEEHAEVEISVRRLAWTDQQPGILERRVDIAFLVPIEEPDKRLEVHPLMDENRVVGLPLDHRLAARESVSIKDLAEEPVVTSRSVPDEVARWWSALPRPDGSTPPLGPRAESVEEMLEVVAMGHGVCLVSRSVEAFYGRPDLVFVPVSDADKVPIALAWRGDDERPLLREFLAVARRVAEGMAR
jgi:DNA-binding transcriptional LysR family regulator